MINTGIISPGLATYSPVQAVFLYQEENRSGHSNRTFATIHPVLVANGQAVMKAGRPANTADLKDLVNSLLSRGETSQASMQWNESMVLAQGLGRTIWYTPPQVRTLHFKCSQHVKPHFDGAGRCPLPGLVWMQMENSLFLWAFKGQERPNQDTKLFQAPLFNVWGRGQVCWGSSARVSNDQVGDPKAWEKAFFESAFSHPNFTEKNRLTRRTDPVKFWQRMLKTPMETFPETELVALDLKVGDLLGVDVMSRLQKIPKPKGEF